MPRIETVTVRITTGSRGCEAPVRIRFNSFELPLKTTHGGTAPGERYEGTFRLSSIGHSCALIGPRSGPWDLERLEVVFDYGPAQPAAVHDFGTVILEIGQELDVLTKPPPPAFDV